MMQYGYIELYQLLDNTNPKSLVGFEIKPDGIWIDPPTEIDLNYLTPAELAAMRGPFRAHDMSKPVLPLPCSGKDLQSFMASTGFDCKMVDVINTDGDGPAEQQPVAESVQKDKPKPPPGRPDSMITKVIGYAVAETTQNGVSDLLVFLRNRFEKGDKYLKDRLKSVSETDRERAIVTKQKAYTRDYVKNRLSDLKRAGAKEK